MSHIPSRVTAPVWARPTVVFWSQRLLESFRHWTGRDLLDRSGSVEEQAEGLFFAPVVVVSHGKEADPILNYGNQAALDLWEVTWERLIGMPSRQTAEPVNQLERTHMLELVEQQGYYDRYRGVRISSTGRRFLIEEALVWNVIDEQKRHIGQAATFSRWTRLS